MTFSPTKSLLLLALALLGLAVASIWLQELVFFWLLGLAAFVVLLGADVFMLPRRDDLALARVLPAESSVGGEVELALTVANNGDRTINGTCARGPDGNGPLACKPNDPPPR